MQMRRIALAILAATLVTAPARAGNVASARSFVAWIYSHYPTATHEPVFDALEGATKRSIFAPSLIALIDEDARLAHGEVGALDGDPLCDCQDDGGLTFKIASVRSAGPARASAVIVRSYADSKDPEVGTITLDLTMAKGRWRVYDVRSKDTPSLRAYLIKSNRAAH
jgi:hypothetical protein